MSFQAGDLSAKTPGRMEANKVDSSGHAENADASRSYHRKGLLGSRD